MAKQWFILHALSGHELKVQKNITSRVQQEEMEDVIGEVLIPSEKVSEVKQGKKTISKAKTAAKTFSQFRVMSQDKPELIKLIEKKREILKIKHEFGTNATPNYDAIRDRTGSQLHKVSFKGGTIQSLENPTKFTQKFMMGIAGHQDEKAMKGRTMSEILDRNYLDHRPTIPHDKDKM